MLHFNDVKSNFDKPTWVFDMLNVNFDHKKLHKKWLNVANNESRNFEATIKEIIGWKVFVYGLSFSVVDSLCRLVIAIKRS